MIDVDCNISIVTMSYNATNEVYIIGLMYAEELENFVTKRNV